MTLKRFGMFTVAALMLAKTGVGGVEPLRYAIVGTGISTAYDSQGPIPMPHRGEAFYGQDATSTLPAPRYVDNADGTVRDALTGLVWQKEMGPKMTLAEAANALAALNRKGQGDWRIPTIKELFSLALYSGRVMGPNAVTPFLDTRYFHQPIGDKNAGEREIDAQTWSSTPCPGPTMGRDRSQFGFNFVDGRIKAYPLKNPRSGDENRLYFRFVRGNPEYGINDFHDNGDGTITDRATGLMWEKTDSGVGMDWKSALQYASTRRTGGYQDWRLPSVKELQSLVDYSISYEKDHRPAISPPFRCSTIVSPGGEKDVPYYWSGTTLLDGPHPGNLAAYVIFGRAMARPRPEAPVVDAHGSGAVRSDPKSGGHKGEPPTFFGPQGDYQAFFNFVRCVRTL